MTIDEVDRCFYQHLLCSASRTLLPVSLGRLLLIRGLLHRWNKLGPWLGPPLHQRPLQWAPLLSFDDDGIDGHEFQFGDTTNG